MGPSSVWMARYAWAPEMNMKMRTLILLVIPLTGMTIAAAVECPAFSRFKPTDGPLALMNCDFHTLYQKQVNEIISSLGAAGGRPVILNLGGTLTFKYNGTTEKARLLPDAAHGVKTFAHAVFAIYLALNTVPSGPLPDETKTTLTQIRTHIQAALRILPTLQLTAEEAATVSALGDDALAFLNGTLSNNQYTPASADRFYKKVYPSIHSTLQTVSDREWHTLDTLVTRWLRKLSPAERKKLGVVVTTVHQARANEISVAYFKKTFGFQTGEGAEHENGMVVMESGFTEDAALSLLARHYLDRKAAAVLFGDPERLQQDVLGPEPDESSSLPT